ncbi:MAG: phosphatidylglycerophosphatase A [Desulfovibrionaceae bacterium]|nr:phosphatidylglycerophosphatase A [Desulfovibrionaceae bacterium]
MLKKYGSGNPSQLHPMSLSFAFSSVPHAIATFFGSGLLRPASGTWGTFAAWILFYLTRQYFSVPVWILIITATFFIGAWASEITGKDIGVHDHSSIVIDEVFAVWLVQLTLPHTLPYQLAAFAAFRFFDIVKIPPASYFDTSPLWKNGFGVMLDDLVAAVQAILLLQLIKLFL